MAVPHPENLALDHPHREEILVRHGVAMAVDQAGYTDPETGFFVFTAKTLAAEGKCCAMVCRHCPFKR